MRVVLKSAQRVRMCGQECKFVLFPDLGHISNENMEGIPPHFIIVSYNKR